MMARGYITLIHEADGRGAVYVLRYRHVNWPKSEYEYVSYSHCDDAVTAYKNIRKQTIYVDVKLYELEEMIG